MADKYGAELGVTGRLMTEEEAFDLYYNGNKDILYSNLYFWLASHHGDDSIGCVYEIDKIDTLPFYVDDLAGVRPVVEVLKSNIIVK